MSYGWRGTGFGSEPSDLTPAGARRALAKAPADRYASASEMLDAVGDEVAVALELELVVGLGRRRRRFDARLQDRLRRRIQQRQEVLAARVGVGIGEQAVVEAHLGLHAIGHAHPGDGGFGFDAVGAGGAALGAGDDLGLHFGQLVAVGQQAEAVAERAGASVRFDSGRDAARAQAIAAASKMAIASSCPGSQSKMTGMGLATGSNALIRPFCRPWGY